MEVQCIKVKIKAGMTDLMIDWINALYNQMDLVYESLISETMVVESMFLERAVDADYLIFYTRAESLQKANQILMQSTNPVDTGALEMMQKAWESAVPLQKLFDVDRIATVQNDISKLL